MTQETIFMKAIVVTDQAAETAGMKLVERPEPQPSINDVVVQVYASGFRQHRAGLAFDLDQSPRPRPNTVDPRARAGRNGHRTRLRHDGVSVEQRVFGLTDWYRDGLMAVEIVTPREFTGSVLVI
jgi:hypothetical protein